MPTLDVKTRDSKEKLETLRKDGSIPAVFYGRLEKSTSISVPAAAFEKIWKEAGESSIITLKGDFGEHDALIHDIDFDPLTGRVRHADFYVVEKGKKVSVNVSVEFDGEAPAVKDLGGILVKVIHEVEVEAMPKDLPHELHIDVSSLVDFDSQVTAGDIKLPAGVTLLTGADEVIAAVARPKEEKEEESAPIDLSSIEVEKKGKTEEEGEVAAE